MDEKIHARVIIEMMGAPKGHVEKTMQLLLEKLEQDEAIALVGHETADPAEKDKFWVDVNNLRVDKTKLINALKDKKVDQVKIDVIVEEIYKLKITDVLN